MSLTITNIKIELPDADISIGKGELCKDAKDQLFRRLRITTPNMTVEYWDSKGPHYAILSYDDLVAAIKSERSRRRKR